MNTFTSISFKFFINSFVKFPFLSCSLKSTVYTIHPAEVFIAKLPAPGI
ncbi:MULTISPECIES: hypothetical protein [Dictyoglomus]